MPIMVKNNLKGVLYLENNLFEGLFTKHRMDFLLVLTSQMAITLENTRFFNAQVPKKKGKKTKKKGKNKMKEEGGQARRREGGTSQMAITLENTRFFNAQVLKRKKKTIGK
eukprot:Phypoly_transcript_21435.p1 GENE.Phypoly_transcript_21435~~Phypoly_transcript_21435.p1  ORF type:complete len:111 (+),score=26.43 Phypoly_transcript_21435:261-593(+)